MALGGGGGASKSGAGAGGAWLGAAYVSIVPPIFAAMNADRVYVLEHARIAWEGPPDRFAEEAGAGLL